MKARHGLKTGKKAVTSASRKRPHAGHETTMHASLTKTHYINVDLDVFARVPLDELAEAMGPKAFVLYVGKHGRKHSAHFELGASHRGLSADVTIRGLVRLVERLPNRARKMWKEASSREFNIGIESGFAPHGFELRLRAETLASIVRIGATVAVTVYAPELGPDGRPRPESMPPTIEVSAPPVVSAAGRRSGTTASLMLPRSIKPPR